MNTCGDFVPFVLLTPPADKRKQHAKFRYGVIALILNIVLTVKSMQHSTFIKFSYEY
jgi:hypothetical protein